MLLKIQTMVKGIALLPGSEDLPESAAKNTSTRPDLTESQSQFNGSAKGWDRGGSI